MCTLTPRPSSSESCVFPPYSWRTELQCAVPRSSRGIRSPPPSCIKALPGRCTASSDAVCVRLASAGLALSPHRSPFDSPPSRLPRLCFQYDPPQARVTSSSFFPSSRSHVYARRQTRVVITHLLCVTGGDGRCCTPPRLSITPHPFRASPAFLCPVGHLNHYTCTLHWHDRRQVPHVPEPKTSSERKEKHTFQSKLLPIAVCRCCSHPRYTFHSPFSRDERDNFGSHDRTSSVEPP